MSSHPQASAPSWSRQEFEGLDLGDTRLNNRLVDIADAVAAQPMSPISAACGDWSAVKAAYRFFDNDKVSAEKVLDPHFQQIKCGFGMRLIKAIIKPNRSKQKKATNGLRHSRKRIPAPQKALR